MEDKFGWQSGQIIIKKKSKNAKGDGYNPNRDPKSGRFTFGSGGSLNRDMTQVDTSYRGSHGAPNRDDEVSSPGHDLDGERGTFPSDIYSDKAARLYSSGYEAIDREAVAVIKDMKGQPESKVMIYRAVPKKAEIEHINPGDWVAITKGYADYHGESNLNNEYKVLVQEVRAKDIWNNGDSIQGWGYDPTIDLNFLQDMVKNGRGYNPNRDPETGQFTWGAKGEEASGVGANIGNSGKVKLYASGGPGRSAVKVTDKTVQYGIGEDSYMEFEVTPLERSLFTEHGLKLTLGTPNTDKNLKKYNGYYLPSSRSLNLNVAKATDNPGRFEKTFYHEIGHVVDHMKSDFRHDGYSKGLFGGRAKTNPYVIVKEAMAESRVYESIRSMYKIPESKMPKLTEKEFDRLTKANDFMMIKTPGHVNPNGQEYVVPYFSKKQITYYRSPSEVFAETYAMSRIEPEKLQSISETVANDFKEYHQ